MSDIPVAPVLLRENSQTPPTHFQNVAEDLKRIFRENDPENTGSISRKALHEILRKLNPKVEDAQLDDIFEAVDKRQSGVIEYDEFVDLIFALEGKGPELPDGRSADKSLALLHNSVSQIKQEPNDGWGSKALANKVTWLNEICDLLDPCKNPTGYRLCQDAALERGAVKPLLCIAQQGFNDLLRGTALTTLGRLAFGNEAAAANIAAEAQFLPILENVLATGTISNKVERLEALQLAQAVIASMGNSAGEHVVPKLVPHIAQVLPAKEPWYPVHAKVGLEILVSSSFAAPAAVQAALPWLTIASLLGDAAERPSWLSADPLDVLLCGILTANILALEEPKDKDSPAYKSAKERLLSSGFLAHFVACLEAAAARREWPAKSNAFHNPSRLATLVPPLVALGYAEQLKSAVTPLVAVNEATLNADCTKALLALCSRSPLALKDLLDRSAFRTGILDTMAKAGDEPEALELASFLDTMDMHIETAQKAFTDGARYNEHAPTPEALLKLFACHASKLDSGIDLDTFLAALQAMPLGPAKAVAAAIKGMKPPSSISFTVFAQFVYGTEILPGLWPSFMEEVAKAYKNLDDSTPSLETLLTVFNTFEQDQKISVAALVEGKVMNALNLSAEGDHFENAVLQVQAENSAGLDVLKFELFIGGVCSALKKVQAAQNEQVEG